MTLKRANGASATSSPNGGEQEPGEFQIALLTWLGTCPCCGRLYIFQRLNGDWLPRVGPVQTGALLAIGMTPLAFATQVHKWRLSVIERAARLGILAEFV